MNQAQNFDLDPEEDISEDALAKMAKVVEEMKNGTPAPAVMLWEGAPTDATARAIQQRCGIVSIEFSPCELVDPADLTGGANYLKLMNENLDRLMEALGGG